MKLNRILAPTDFSAASRMAIGRAHDMCKAWDAELVILFVEKPLVNPHIPVPLQDDFKQAQENMRKYAQSRLDEWLEELKDIQVTYQIHPGHPVSTILEVAEEMKADMICMATRGWSGRHYSGSVTERVVRNSNLPVLVYPIHKSREEESPPRA